MTTKLLNGLPTTQPCSTHGKFTNKRTKRLCYVFRYMKNISEDFEVNFLYPKPGFSCEIGYKSDTTVKQTVEDINTCKSEPCLYLKHLGTQRLTITTLSNNSLQEECSVSFGTTLLSLWGNGLWKTPVKFCDGTFDTATFIDVKCDDNLISESNLDDTYSCQRNTCNCKASYTQTEWTCGDVRKKLI